MSRVSKTGNQLRENILRENILSLESPRNPSSAPVQPSKHRSAIPLTQHGSAEHFSLSRPITLGSFIALGEK